MSQELGQLKQEGQGDIMMQEEVNQEDKEQTQVSHHYTASGLLSFCFAILLSKLSFTMDYQYSAHLLAMSYVSFIVIEYPLLISLEFAKVNEWNVVT